jgi:hypothetical protein
MKPPDAAEENRSALTGRTLEQIATENDAQWQSNRTPIPDLDLDSLPPSAMSFVEPMQCKLTASLPEGGDWEYELLCGPPHNSSSVAQFVMWS